MGIKLNVSVFVGEIRENSTATWKFGLAQPDGSLVHVENPNFPIFKTISARKIGAKLNMKKGNNYQKEEIEHQIQMSDDTREQPDSASSLRRHIAATLFQHHPFVGNNGHALQPPSLASPYSSIEVAPQLPIVTSASHLEFTHQGEVSCNVNTSAELLKVLNCIRSLEEQHTSLSSLMKTLRKELKQSRVRIKKLLQEKERDRQDLNERMEQNASDIAFRIRKEQDRTRNAVLLARDEIERERKLRKHSESLHRKLARELSEVKSYFCTSLEEIKQERNTRILLENLCEEFAKGITGYEQMVRSLRHNRPDIDGISMERPDQLILHISESWLDERQQMKLAEATCDPAHKNTIVDRLRFDIESFLRAKQPANVNGMALKKSLKYGLRRHSYESFQLNDTTSAPNNGDHEEDYVGSGLNILESIKHLSVTGTNSAYKPQGDCGINSTTSHPCKSRNVLINSELQSSLENKFQEHNLTTASHEGSHVQVKNYEKSEDTQKGKQKQAEACKGHKIHSLTRHRSLSSNDRTFMHCTEYSLEHSASSTHPATKQHTLSRITTPKPQVFESSRKGHEDNSLRAMLLEAKSES